MSIEFSKLQKHFSETTNTGYTQALAALHTAGTPYVDLVNTPWYENGIAVSDSLIDEAYRFGVTQVRCYHPDSRGHYSLRRAVADWYGRRGEVVNPESIVITPGSSFAYLSIFRLLGDNAEILCPKPSYPLFEDIAAVAGWSVETYPLEPSNNWSVDPEKMSNRISNLTKAICLVSPHNPTGAILSEDELVGIGAVSARLSVPVLFDEVFCEFLNGDPHRILPRPQSEQFPLVFLLNGLSKFAALPGHKIGWIIIRGFDQQAVKDSINALDLMLDTFLPVSEVAQEAAAYLLNNENGNSIDTASKQLAEKIMLRRSLTGKFARKFNIDIQLPPAGTYAIVDLPSDVSAELLAVELMEQERIVVHPGYFYDLPYESIVFTYLASEDVLSDALPRMFQLLASKLKP